MPALLSLPVLALRWIGPRTAGIGHAIVIGALFSLFVANAWVALFGSDTSTLIFGATVAGAGILFGCVFLAFPVVQTGTVYAAWAVPIFAAWFLFMTPSGDVAMARSGDLPEAGEIQNPVPIVLLVFDEFPVATLIDSQGNLLGDLFPNLAELAGDGVWYRNAVGVRQQTEEALPSILSGIGADEGALPISSDHPLNLFTLFSDAYDIAAVETVTNLCPDFACSNSSRRIAPWLERWTGLGVDLAVVYGHLTTPARSQMTCRRSTRRGAISPPARALTSTSSTASLPTSTTIEGSRWIDSSTPSTSMEQSPPFVSATSSTPTTRGR